MKLDETEKLMDRAYKLERSGDRVAAIEIYNQVAKGDSEHAIYARNCAEKLVDYEQMAGPPEPIVNGVAWRHKNLLLTRNKAELDPPCLFNGSAETLQKSELKLKLENRSNGSVQYLLFQIVGPFAAIFRMAPQEFSFAAQLSRSADRRKKVWKYSKFISVAGIFVFVGSAATAAEPSWQTWLFLSAVASFLAAVVFSKLQNLFRIKWVRGQYVAIAGVSKSYLNSLDEFPLVWKKRRWLERTDKSI